MIILRGPNGERKVPEGAAYTKLPGEIVIGSDGGSNIDPIIDRIGAAAGVPLGKATALLLHPLAKVFGKENCTACEGRAMALDFFTRLTQRYGAIQSVILLKELFTIAAKSDPDAVAGRIREMLEVQ